MGVLGKLTRPARPKLTKAERMTARRSVAQMLEDIDSDVARLPSSALRDMLPVLVEAEKETAAGLRRWLAGPVSGQGLKPDERFTAHQHRRVLAQLRQARVAITKRLTKEPGWTKKLENATLKGLNAGNLAAGELATAHIVEELATFSTIFGESLNPIPLEKAAIMAKGDRALVPRFERSAKRYGQECWGDIKTQFAIGLARNETIDELTKRLVRLGGPKGMVDLGNRAEEIAEGLFKRYTHWAERLARTEVINAYNVHAQEGLREAHSIDGGIKKRWDASLDSRLCSTCHGLHGEVVGVEEEFSNGSEGPPAHPNCRCARVAWHEAWEEKRPPQTETAVQVQQQEQERQRAAETEATRQTRESVKRK